ncbi:hypothetical protein F9B85_03145 [Heliorestis acidaminivorans]|uniref:DUF8042 domain-containing protein n=1 Tax=Heliorestis acidaminivorans TaxID=553427 RepID=A0A6I0F133_9FIRM|nr:hypothetical protein [Heliorestis acidaminivorans]KAB2953631.1 hypothetical protein F9B85_03145 [Heliorestis acidaminivorans]
MELEQGKAKMILELAEFGLGALILSQFKLEQGLFTEAMEIIKDVEARYWHIYDLVNGIEESIVDKIMMIGENVADSLHYVTTAYSEKEIRQVMKYMEISLLPMYQRWEQELEKSLLPLVTN